MTTRSTVELATIRSTAELVIDTIDGGAGNDTINGGAGIDMITGGAGDKDIFIIAYGEGGDSIDFELPARGVSGAQDLVHLKGFPSDKRAVAGIADDTDAVSVGEVLVFTVTG